MANWMSKTRLTVATMAMLLASSCSGGAPQNAAQRHDFNIGWSIYAGWMPWPYAQKAGIVKKWADKYGVKINFVQVNDYVESVNQFNAGKLDGVTVTNMDALTIPAAAGRDTSAIILGDYSDGNDGIVLKNAKSLADIKGRTVYLVELSVSHYLLARGLSSVGLQLSDVKTVNTSDADIVAAFANPAATAVVTWNPQLTEAAKVPNAKLAFNSHQIPAEILDLLAVDTATLKANPNLGKALAGIWYETIGLMQQKDAAGRRRPCRDGQNGRVDTGGLRCAACHHAPVRHAEGCRGRHHRAHPGRHDDQGARFQLLQGPVRHRCEVGGCGRDWPARRQDAGRQEQREAAVRPELYGTGGGG